MPGTPAHLGPNFLLTVMVPYFIATALQDTHLRLGLIIATTWSGCHIVLCGLLAFATLHRKVFPYILEIVQVVLWAVLLGVTYTSDKARADVQHYFNFIVLASFAGAGVVSMAVNYPLGLQHVQELVPWVYSRHDLVISLGFHTTSLFSASSTICCLLYLVPVCKDKAEDHWHLLNLIFRLIVPCVVMGITVLLMRFWPDFALGHLRQPECGAESLWWKYPVTYGMPRVIDNAMFAPLPKPALNPYAAARPPASQYCAAPGVAGPGGIGSHAAPGPGQPLAMHKQVSFHVPAAMNQPPPTSTPVQMLPQQLPAGSPAAAYAPVHASLQARPLPPQSGGIGSCGGHAPLAGPGQGYMTGAGPGLSATGIQGYGSGGGAMPWAGQGQLPPGAGYGGGPAAAPGPGGYAAPQKPGFAVPPAPGVLQVQADGSLHDSGRIKAFYPGQSGY